MNKSRRDGRRQAELSRPFGTLHCCYAFPALKRRAILEKSLRDSLSFCRSTSDLCPRFGVAARLPVARVMAPSDAPAEIRMKHDEWGKKPEFFNLNLAVEAA